MQGLLLCNSKAFNQLILPWEKGFHLKEKKKIKTQHRLPDFKVRGTTFDWRALGQKVVMSEGSYQTWAFSYSLRGEFDQACKLEQLCRCWFQTAFFG